MCWYSAVDVDSPESRMLEAMLSDNCKVRRQIPTQIQNPNDDSGDTTNMFNRVLAAFSVLAILSICLIISTAEADVVMDGLIGYWSFDDVQGDVAADLVGSNDVMLMRGASPELFEAGPSDPQITSGKIGMGIEFDGDGDYAQSINNVPISGTSPRTLSAWIKFNGFVSQKQVPVGWGWEGETSQICEGELYAITAWDGPRIALWGVCNDHVSTKNFEQDTWAHVSATYDNETELKIYVNGEEVYNKSDINPLMTGNAKMTLGKQIFTFADRAWTNGVVDEVAVYDRALTSDEVMQNYMAEEFGAVAVNSAGKLATAWAALKVSSQ